MESDLTTVLIINLPIECDEQRFHHLVQQFGTVETCFIQDFDGTGDLNKRFRQGVIKFTSNVVASAALRRLNGYSLFGSQLK